MPMDDRSPIPDAPPMEFRRRAPRVPTDWIGRCGLEDQRQTEWACTVIDISLIGVGVEISVDEPADLVGRKLIVDVRPPIGTSVRLQLLGRVMNQGRTAGGRTRLGLQFVDLTESEAAVLQVIEQMRIFW